MTAIRSTRKVNFDFATIEELERALSVKRKETAVEIQVRTTKELTALSKYIKMDDTITLTPEFLKVIQSLASKEASYSALASGITTTLQENNVPLRHCPSYANPEGTTHGAKGLIQSVLSTFPNGVRSGSLMQAIFAKSKRYERPYLSCILNKMHNAGEIGYKPGPCNKIGGVYYPSSR